jgi:hypothetical protein
MFENGPADHLTQSREDAEVRKEQESGAPFAVLCVSAALRQNNGLT